MFRRERDHSHRSGDHICKSQTRSMNSSPTNSTKLPETDEFVMTSTKRVSGKVVTGSLRAPQLHFHCRRPTIKPPSIRVISMNVRSPGSAGPDRWLTDEILQCGTSILGRTVALYRLHFTLYSIHCIAFYPISVNRDICLVASQMYSTYLVTPKTHELSWCPPDQLRHPKITHFSLKMPVTLPRPLWKGVTCYVTEGAPLAPGKGSEERLEAGSDDCRGF